MAFIVMLSMGLVVPFLFSAIYDFTESSLFNISHRDGFLDDFSNLVIKVITGNESVTTTYQTLQMEAGQWIYVNITVPPEDYTLSILADEVEVTKGSDGEGGSGATGLGLETFTIPPDDRDFHDYGVYINLTTGKVNRTGLVVVFGDNETPPSSSSPGARLAYQEVLVQGPAETGNPVSWTLTVTDKREKEKNYTFALPLEAANVKVSLFK
ncbi:TPA: hypothetical protein EYP38_01905, partial [Candidatus Micrarchaeota archaeon]|nr:hypothetical protein [Candidatus Micrarchaeota archaeon]